MEPEMRSDLRRAAERIAARQQPPPPSAVELSMGIDSRRTPRWSVDGESWLEYVEDGPFEVARVLRRELTRRASASGAVVLDPEPPRDPLLSSPLHGPEASPRSMAAAPAAITLAMATAASAADADVDAEPEPEPELVEALVEEPEVATPQPEIASPQPSAVQPAADEGML
eukprot:4247075-Prymnesium_polylepis.1